MTESTSHHNTIGIHREYFSFELIRDKKTALNIRRFPEKLSEKIAEDFILGIVF